MKQTNKLCLAAVFAALVFTACNSSKLKVPDVPPLALLQEDSLLYVAVPVKLQKNLTVNLIHSIMPSIPQKTIESLAVRCDTLYAGIGNDSDSKRLEVSVKGDFPPLAINNALSEKNGWTRELRKYDGGALLPFATSVYSSEATGDTAIAFPAQSILCVSRAIDTMLNRYAPMPETVNQWPGSDWLSDASGGMRFYICRPARAITALKGSPMESLVEAVYGSVTGDGEDISVDFFLKVKTPDSSNSSAVTSALITLLRISMMKAGVQISQSDDYTIKVAGMKMKAESLSAFLGA